MARRCRSSSASVRAALALVAPQRIHVVAQPPAALLGKPSGTDGFGIGWDGPSLVPPFVPLRLSGRLTRIADVGESRVAVHPVS